MSLSRGGQLVAPGALTPYSGGGGRRRQHGGYVSVRKPADGFFVAGSSIKEMNGLYGKSDWVPRSIGDKHEAQLAYRHDQTGWVMVLCDAPARAPTHFNYGAADDETEWLFIDPASEDRFKHEGDTIIPGSGTTWSHVHRRPAASATPPVPPTAAAGESGEDSDSDSVEWTRGDGARVEDAPDTTPGAEATAVPTAEDAGEAVAVVDDADELPWQLIAILSTDMLRKLRGHYRWHEHNIRQAQEGNDLPKLPAYGSEEVAPPADFVPPPLVASDSAAYAMLASPESRAACDAALVELAGWSNAVLQHHKASCHRRAREFDECFASLDAALEMFPSYADAAFERALAFMDRGAYSSAVGAFEQVLHIQREYPLIGSWLVRALAHQRREAEGEKKEDLAGNLGWDGIIPGVAPSPAQSPAPSLAGSGFDAPCSSIGDIEEEDDDAAADAPIDDDDLDDGLMGIDDVAGAASASPSASASAAASDALDARWRSTDHYVVLGVRCDLPVAPVGEELGDDEAKVLKAAYKKLSRQMHPDKRGGSVEAFQRIVKAYEVLSDPKHRLEYDEGAALEREELRDGSLGPEHAEDVARKYFPEGFGFEPFGDPLEDRREREERKRRVEQQRKEREERRQANRAAALAGGAGAERGSSYLGFDSHW